MGSPVEAAPPTEQTAGPEAALSQERARARAEALHTHRGWLLGIDHETSVSFDKVLTMLSAGALGIAVNLGATKGAWVWGLKLSLAFFTASLLSMLFSYQTCRRELERKIRDVDWILKNGDVGELPEHPIAWHEVSTSTLNRSALICLIAGICFLIAFATTNL